MTGWVNCPGPDLVPSGRVHVHDTLLRLTCEMSEKGLGNESQTTPYSFVLFVKGQGKGSSFPFTKRTPSSDRTELYRDVTFRTERGPTKNRQTQNVYRDPLKSLLGWSSVEGRGPDT